MGGYGL